MKRDRCSWREIRSDRSTCRASGRSCDWKSRSWTPAVKDASLRIFTIKKKKKNDLRTVAMRPFFHLKFSGTSPQHFSFSEVNSDG